MSNYQSILVDRDERVGIVTLNRPKELNVINFQLVSELANALEELDRDEEIRCMVITGAGPGIMQAGLEGAGVEHSFGAAIRLPHEQSTNSVIAGDKKLVV